MKNGPRDIPRELSLALRKAMRKPFVALESSEMDILCKLPSRLTHSRVLSPNNYYYVVPLEWDIIDPKEYESLVDLLEAKLGHTGSGDTGVSVVGVPGCVLLHGSEWVMTKQVPRA